MAIPMSSFCLRSPETSRARRRRRSFAASSAAANKGVRLFPEPTPGSDRPARRRRMLSRADLIRTASSPWTNSPTPRAAHRLRRGQSRYDRRQDRREPRCGRLRSECHARLADLYRHRPLRRQPRPHPTTSGRNRCRYPCQRQNARGALMARSSLGFSLRRPVPRHRARSSSTPRRGPGPRRSRECYLSAFCFAQRCLAMSA